jgi:hypothetical protein
VISTLARFSRLGTAESLRCAKHDIVVRAKYKRFGKNSDERFRKVFVDVVMQVA